jgi:DNA primase
MISYKPAKEKGKAMPGVDFDKIRNEITMEQVLDLIGFEPTSQRGEEWYGWCPLLDCMSQERPPFSVNVGMQVYYCHECQSKGNQIHLWAAFTQMLVYPAAIDLCRSLGREVPWTWRW